MVISLFSFSSCPFPGSVLMAAMAQNGLSSNSDAWFTLSFCSTVSSLYLVDPNICCYLLQNYLSDVLPFSVAVISVSHIGEWVPAATEKIVFFVFKRRRKTKVKLLKTSISRHLTTGQDNANCPIPVYSCFAKSYYFFFVLVCIPALFKIDFHFW